MDKLTAIWNLVNGKKSTIGAYFFGVAYAIGKLAGIWNIHYSWIPPTMDTLTEAAAVLTGVGAIHKGIKAISP